MPKASPPTSEPTRNRCRCGHFASPHMRVAPVRETPSGSFALLPTGPCAICGADACPHYAPGD